MNRLLTLLFPLVLNGMVSVALGQDNTPVAPAASPPASSDAEPQESWDDDEWESDDWGEESTLPDGVTASDVYDLKRLTDLALSQNRRIREVKWDLVYARAKNDEAWWQWFPKISIKAALAPGPGYDPPDIEENDPGSAERWLTYQSSEYSIQGILVYAELDAKLPLYTFGKLESGRRMGETGLLLAKENIRLERAKILYELHRVYYSLVMLKEAEELLADAEDNLGKAKRSMTRLLDEHAENVSEQDLYKIMQAEAELATRRSELTTAKHIANKAIRMLTGLPDKATVHIEQNRIKPKELGATPDLLTLRSDFMQNRPELKALGHLSTMKLWEKELEWANYFPNFVLGGGYGVTYTPMTKDISHPYLSDRYNRRSWSLYLGLEYKFDVPLQIARFRAAQSKFHKARATKRTAEEALDLELTAAHREQEEQFERLTVQKKLKTEGRKWMIKELMNFDLGVGKSSDLMSAFGMYYGAAFKHAELLYKLAVNKALLHRLTGGTASLPLDVPEGFKALEEARQPQQ